MKRRPQLDLCTICTQSKYSFEQGIICGLTNDIAHFDNDCKDYLLNEKRLKELRTEAAHMMYHKSDLEFSFNKTNEQAITGKTKPLKQQIFKPRALKPKVFLLPGVLTVLIIIGLVKNPEDYETSFLLFFPVLLILSEFRKTKNNQVQLDFTEQGLKSKKESISWNGILESFLKEDRRGDITTHYLAIITLNRKYKELPISDLEYSPEDIVSCFEHYKKRYKTNF